MTDWNFADIWDTVAEIQPQATAVVHGGRRVSWKDFEGHADNLARWLLAQGVARQDKVAIYLTNCPEYLETVYGATKIGLAPVNTNYRYAEGELTYLWSNADAVAVVFHGKFTQQVARVRAKTPHVRAWLWVDDGTDPCPPWATSYGQVVKSAGPPAQAPWGRSPDDLIMLYTGGTTGMPKGVMWRQDDLFARLNTSGFRRYPPEGGLAEIDKDLRENGPGMSLLPACPLMHGTGSFTSFECLSEGGTVVLLTSRSFDPEELWDTVEREQVNGLVIVGDPFARPMLAALEAQPRRWRLSSVVGMISSGAMWSEEVKKGLLGHHGGMVLVDAFSSSEALGMGSSVSSAEQASRTAEFTLGPDVKVLSVTDDRMVDPGSGEIGVLALGGRNPLGYYKDEAKTAATFRVIDGVRYSIPGDFAEVTVDGRIHVLGRGSVCINTAGEKVFPEEVEEVLKTHRDVRDAVVVGVPHQRFGEEVVAVVEVPTGVLVDEDQLIGHVKATLAGYKAPRRIRVVPSLERSPSGKIDYSRHREEAAAWVQESQAASR